MAKERRKDIVLAIVVAILIPWSSAVGRENQSTIPINSPVTVCFTPGGNCTATILGELASAKKEIMVQAYSFTSAPIAKGLVDAYKRGVKVRVILDKSQRTEGYSSATFLTNAGISTFIDAKHAIAHNKVIIIDGSTVITGSFNFTKAAQEKNAENLLILHDTGLSSEFIWNWQRHQTHSEPYSQNIRK